MTCQHVTSSILKEILPKSSEGKHIYFTASASASDVPERVRFVLSFLRLPARPSLSLGCAYLSTQGWGASHDGLGVLVSTTFRPFKITHLLMTCPSPPGWKEKYI